MATKAIPKEQWEKYFDNLSKNLPAVEVQLEVVDKEIGDQVEVEYSPLLGLSYDPKDDVFEIQFRETHDHLIYHPKEIYVEEEDGKITTIEVVDKEGTRYILRIKPAIPLPE
ncbi:DUF5335 family protein [Aquifex aeolicus]|uniref:Uncharacterized protein aq_1176 n=1 Tax=Aquifex aeolicus (strain VF5) TaxID=224324 RepID=Y1176_AQUAE|nr:DUF5335 family protein [Aquifex aeolicus]O67237.1 RecName: Full=Uncharacterized protein aq_1176 [Aquifex aeolicus VF5]AAC07206.1 putative protein [Aquifex aeolicus VF5]